MPKVSGVFEIFKDLDLIQTPDVVSWLDRNPPRAQDLENYIANLILYPQVAPMSEETLKLDLAILREALKKTPGYFYNPALKKLVIPQNFVERFGGLKNVILAMMDVFVMPDITQVMISAESREEVIGSTVCPKFQKEKEIEFELGVEEKLYTIRQGSLTIIPCDKTRCHLTFRSSDATLISKKDITVESYGGALGIVVDARK
jgi:hypothetical protein